MPISRIFRNQEFGYTTITVERALRDEQGKVVLGVKGKQKGSRKRIVRCVIPRMCRSPMISASISSGRCFRTRRTPG